MLGNKSFQNLQRAAKKKGSAAKSDKNFKGLLNALKTSDNKRSVKPSFVAKIFKNNIHYMFLLGVSVSALFMQENHHKQKYAKLQNQILQQSVVISDLRSNKQTAPILLKDETLIATAEDLPIKELINKKPVKKTEIQVEVEAKPVSQQIIKQSKLESSSFINQVVEETPIVEKTPIYKVEERIIPSPVKALNISEENNNIVSEPIETTIKSDKAPISLNKTVPSKWDNIGLSIEPNALDLSEVVQPDNIDIIATRKIEVIAPIKTIALHELNNLFNTEKPQLTNIQ